jgi:hypothetical protein
MAIDRTKWPQHAARAVDKWICAVDLGQTTDPTAIAILNHRVVPLDKWIQNDAAQNWKQESTEHFEIRHLQRLPLGMPYPAQVQEVANIMARPPLNAGAALVVDETGVGRAVCDLFDVAGLKPVRVTITSGLETTRQGGNSWHVSKTQLISALDARIHTGELRIAPSNEAGALQEELKDFRRKVSEAGRSTWAARTGTHDDLVLACALALWFATSGPKPTIFQPL